MTARGRNRPAWLVALERKRADAGTCRHCGGRVPCWSPYGDSAPGKRHTSKTLDAMHKAGR